MPRIWDHGPLVCRWQDGRRLRTIHQRHGPIDAVHRQEFGDDLSRPAPADFLTESIHARYWPVKVMKGPYALASVSHGNISGTDFCLGCGHLMHIWRCLNLYIEYRVGMKETIKANNFPVKGLSAGISLTFGKQK